MTLLVTTLLGFSVETPPTKTRGSTLPGTVTFSPRLHLGVFIDYLVIDQVMLTLVGLSSNCLSFNGKSPIQPDWTLRYIPPW